jgi:hypothetical protein
VTIEIREVGISGRRFLEVLALHRADRAVLGFLPDAGFRERAQRGTLLGALDHGELVGYALYDLPKDTVKIVHLCVCGSRRESGVARLLIDYLDARHADRRCLQLACRRDFPASSLWPKLGFSPVAERPGRGRDRLPLTIWQRSHDQVDLFTLPDQGREIAALDCNVFKDLISLRPQGAASRHLRDDWVTELVELRVTDELFHEINRCEDRALRETMQREASAFSRLPSKKGAWEQHVPHVSALAPGAGDADHRQVARAVAADARYFVTRDDGLLRAAAAVGETFGTLITRPEDLITSLDRSRYAGGYEPQALHATSVTRVPIDRVTQDELVAAFLNYGAGERASHFREVVRPTLAAPRDHEFLVFADERGKPVGALIISLAGDCVEVKLIRVARADRVGAAVARQLAFLPRREAADRRLSSVLVSDPTPTRAVLEALVDEFYNRDGEGWQIEVGHGFAPAPEPRGGRSEAAEVARIERGLWPQKIRGDLPTFMVSIHPTYASQLFETNLAAGSLFGRDLDLGLSREHIYYRGCGWSGGLRAPARLLWYVKGTQQTGRGYLAASSALLEVARGRPRSLHQRFARLGVWSREEVERAAGKRAEVMALRFADTELFARPLSLSALRELYAATGLEFRAPQSPLRVHERMFCLLYERASAHAA